MTTEAEPQDRMGPSLADLPRWITETALASDDRDLLLDGLCRALLANGLPLWRCNLSTPALDPTVRGVTLIWHDNTGPRLELTAHTPDSETLFARSPIYALMQSGRTSERWRLDTLPADCPFAILHDLRSQGGTDHVMHIASFTPGTALRGVAMSFTTRQPGGFAPDHLAIIESLLPSLALGVCKLSLERTLREALGTYLGRSTALQVLDGHIRRGGGQTVPAAILLTDLRGFTALSDRVDPADLVSWLDEHFDALGDPVARQGGEILKFLGDGFLAIFPVTEPDARPCAVCQAALAAAREALLANAALNGRRRDAGLPALDADIVLHFGEVVYGNVGTARRLDFTVIGRAVNEASRIEKLCGELDQPLLLSDSFAGRCGAPLECVGDFPLRGLERSERVWAPARG